MVLPKEAFQAFAETFDGFALDPIVNGRRGMHRKYVDMRKSMYSVGVPPDDVRRFDERIVDVDNKSVFFFETRSPHDRLFKATFVASLFCRYLRDLGVSEQCVPRLTRADDYGSNGGGGSGDGGVHGGSVGNEDGGCERDGDRDVDGIGDGGDETATHVFVFCCGGESVLAALGRRRCARAAARDVLRLCVCWMQWLVADDLAGNAEESLRYALD